MLLLLPAQGGLGWIVASSLSVGLLSTLFFYFFVSHVEKGHCWLITTESMERIGNKNEREVYPVSTMSDCPSSLKPTSPVWHRRGLPSSQ